MRAYIDTILEIRAPEYIVLQYESAGPAARFFAMFIDHMVMGVLVIIVLILSTIFAILGEIAAQTKGEMAGAALFIFFVIFFTIYWFYFFLFEWLNRGRTPGKMALGLRVVSRGGTSLTTSQVAVRNFLRIADMFPVIFIGWVIFLPTYAAALLSVSLSGNNFLRLGDLAAGSIVVRERKEKQAPSLDVSPKIEEISSRLSVKIMPSPVLARAIHDFAMRKHRLHPARSVEIARKVEGCVRKCFGAEHIECEADDLLLAAHHLLFSGNLS